MELVLDTKTISIIVYSLPTVTAVSSSPNHLRRVYKTTFYRHLGGRSELLMDAGPNQWFSRWW